MFQIKICGITDVDDALAAANAGADAVGLNFYEQSPRYVLPQVADEIVRQLPTSVKKVGVFVNAAEATIRTACARHSLDFVQLHGDESAEFMATLSGMPVIRAFRPESSFQAVHTYLLRCEELNCLPVMVLIDAYKKGEFGGTGKTANWHTITSEKSKLRGIPLILAGGLNPENVALAISTARPDAVDTASGVEISPGRKSPERLNAFIAEAKRAFDLEATNR